MWENERRRGDPRPEEERATRHEERYPGEPLPPRGTGLDRVGQVSTGSGGLFLLGIVGGLGLLLYIGTRK